jgi:Protein of unknown function (DUF3467)
MGSPESAKPSGFPLEVPEDGIFETYANMVDADWTLSDVSLRFMQLIHAAKEEEPTTVNRELVVLERASITLPWWSAKILASMLTDLVRSYESVNGELTTPNLAPRPSPKS